MYGKIWVPIYGVIGSSEHSKIIKEKYGTQYAQSSDIVRKKISKALSSKESQDKMIKTNLKRYGVKRVSQAKEIKEKSYNTALKNRSHRTSKEENILFEILKELYPNIIRFYINKEQYPYNCDFYIPDLSLYIEYQGSGYHHNSLYNKLVDDKELRKLQIKAKTNQTYQDIINTWTIIDIEKWNISKSNRINMLFLYPNFYNWKYYIKHVDNIDIKESIKQLLFNYIECNYKNKTNVQLIYGEYKRIT